MEVIGLGIMLLQVVLMAILMVRGFSMMLTLETLVLEYVAQLLEIQEIIMEMIALVMLQIGFFVGL